MHGPVFRITDVQNKRTSRDCACGQIFTIYLSFDIQKEHTMLSTYHLLGAHYLLGPYFVPGMRHHLLSTYAK